MENPLKYLTMNLYEFKNYLETLARNTLVHVNSDDTFQTRYIIGKVLTFFDKYQGCQVQKNLKGQIWP